MHLRGGAVWQVEHRNKAGGQRLKLLCGSATKRFYVFSNEHHKCVLRGFFLLFFNTSTGEQRLRQACLFLMRRTCNL
jgi:hypothetical protein